MKIFLTVVLIAVIVFIVFVAIGTLMSCYYSIPYEEWVQLERREQRKIGVSRKEREDHKMVEDKINLFLEELEKQDIEIAGETAILCNDGVVMFMPNEEGKVDIGVVRNLVKLDYTLGITDKDVELWGTAGEIMQELGGVENGRD